MTQLTNAKKEEEVKVKLPDGRILRFYPVESDEGVEQKYSFDIEGDAEMTTKLLNATKKHRIKYSYIKTYADKLSNLITEDKLTAIVTGEQISNYYEAFRKKFGCQPEFEFSEDNSKPVTSFTAKLINSQIVDQSITGSGRRKACAKVNAIKIALGEENADENVQHENTQTDHYY